MGINLLQDHSVFSESPDLLSEIRSSEQRDQPTMKYAVTGIKLAICLAVLSAGPAFTQTALDEAVSNKAAVPVAHVYVQTTPGAMVYAAAANGQLTPVAGSPFKVTGQMEDISGKLLFSVGNTYLHTYPIESNGAIGRQISQINTASYGGSECGGTAGQGSVLDHSGKYLYVQLNESGGCAAWQSYRVEPDGFLQFIGDVEYYVADLDEDGYALSSAPPTISSNDKFGYGAFNWGYGSLWNNSWSAFQIATGGLLEANSSFNSTGPNGNGKYIYTPLLAAADNADHLAVIENVQDINGLLGYQVASFTINPTNGQVSSTNDFHNMPFLNTPVAEDTPITL
jgi:hypothetical protein